MSVFHWKTDNNNTNSNNNKTIATVLVTMLMTIIKIMTKITLTITINITSNSNKQWSNEWYSFENIDWIYIYYIYNIYVVLECGSSAISNCQRSRHLTTVAGISKAIPTPTMATKTPTLITLLGVESTCHCNRYATHSHNHAIQFAS